MEAAMIPISFPIPSANAAGEANQPASGTEVLEVIRLARKEWRIVDTRVSGGEPARLLGFIERLGRSRYEVQWVGETAGWAYVTSFDLALAALVNRDEFAGTIQAARSGGLSWVEPALLPLGHRRHSGQPDQPDQHDRQSRHKKGVPTSNPNEGEPDGEPTETEPNGAPVDNPSGQRRFGNEVNEVPSHN
jgi:hypothetical protein